MTIDQNASTDTNADIFSRGSLKLTYDLLRHRHPQLALDVRNITGGKLQPKSLQDNSNKHSDCFQVSLDSRQVRAVVEALVECNQGAMLEGSDVGRSIMAKALIDDWLALARYMVEQQER